MEPFRRSLIMIDLLLRYVQGAANIIRAKSFANNLFFSRKIYELRWYWKQQLECFKKISLSFSAADTGQIIGTIQFEI